ncbi:carbohydrate kinase family protein [Pseudofrankia inefficax]|uniref:PfkB domain protein n=1 Tax=Pseudofrankia inefficax (strain DSM 45817 / CECT 9037 / DDB 130130 / EuI1c) TaxID=298654 RepID=E3JDE1_PSEI1|nr:carbohydrate kinase family protein [Pseudofrankia inefficax]ADP83574.1 PfkB domain protein [Pseudofrankia inefficax]
MLVVGDLNPDLVLQGDVVPRFGQAEQLLDTAALVVGGSAGITAHGLARLGRPVALAAAIGADGFGATMTSTLARAGVDTSALVIRPDQPTGLTVVLSTGPDRAILTLPGTIPTLTAAEVLAVARRLVPAGLGHVHVCSLFLQPGLAAGLADLLAELRSAGVTTSLDTNDDPTGAWAGVGRLLGHLDLLLPNRREALALARAAGAAGPDLDLTAACRLLAGHGPLVVVKDGDQGARAIGAEGELASAPAVPTVPVDATGAGDTFNAAFLDAWMRSLPIPECLRRGVVAGSRSVRAVGGTAAQPTLDQLVDDRRALRP